MRWRVERETRPSGSFIKPYTTSPSPLVYQALLFEVRHRDVHGARDGRAHISISRWGQ